MPRDAVLDGILIAPEISALFSDGARLQAMLDVEAALARAEAAVGIFPAHVAGTIEACCSAETLDIGDLTRAARSAGNLAIPLVKQLTATVAARDGEAARWVHWGATSQDIIDTGFVLQLRRAMESIEADLTALGDACAALAERHRETPMAARTWMQHALPLSFGLKAARWLDAVRERRESLRTLRARVLVVQLGGAAGTLSALGPHGLSVVEALGRELDLGVPVLPWHTERARFAEAAAYMGVLAGVLGKMARDILLMTQSEVSEAAEPSGVGRGGSSTLPHKRNAVTAAAVHAAAIRAPGLVATVLSGMLQEHERAAGGWQAEWWALPDLCILAAGALHEMATLMPRLEIDVARMRHNLDATHGLILSENLSMALARSVGREAARSHVEELCRRAVDTRRPLAEVALADELVREHLSAERVERLLDPAGNLGMSAALTDRAVGAWRGKAARKTARSRPGAKRDRQPR